MIAGVNLSSPGIDGHCESDVSLLFRDSYAVPPTHLHVLNTCKILSPVLSLPSLAAAPFGLMVVTNIPGSLPTWTLSMPPRMLKPSPKDSRIGRYSTTAETHEFTHTHTHCKVSAAWAANTRRCNGVPTSFPFQDYLFHYGRGRSSRHGYWSVVVLACKKKTKQRSN